MCGFPLRATTERRLPDLITGYRLSESEHWGKTVYHTETKADGIKVAGLPQPVTIYLLVPYSEHVPYRSDVIVFC